VTNPSRVMFAFPARSAGPLLALAGLRALTAQSPAPAASGPLPWCTRIAIVQCRPLEVRAPSGLLRLAVANTDAQREHGLMNVAFVPPGRGMIFVFADGDQERGFWMKNTITPLDMIFVQTDGTVSGVAVNVPATPPKASDDKVARRNGVGKYVIELGAGQAGMLGILPGSRLVIPPVAAQ
jgi:uncharacterized membrane protein (UPF0127 family)